MARARLLFTVASSVDSGKFDVRDAGLGAGYRAGLISLRFRWLITKRHRRFVAGHDSIVTDGHPMHVRREVLQDGLSVTHRFEVNDKLPVPRVSENRIVQATRSQGIGQLRLVGLD